MKTIMIDKQNVIGDNLASKQASKQARAIIYNF